ncbi:PmoA family protein [Paenibacillus sp. CC-CFT747]|nr:PmoA family protein [Paenibacillus sp. CC-CFT747]
MLTQHAHPNRRPYLHPIVAPDGRGVLTEDAPAHHPWQHGLYVGLNQVNNWGFWTEGVTNSPNDGTFHPEGISDIQLADDEAGWVVKTALCEPAGDRLLTERQSWSLRDRNTVYELDLEWTLTAEKAITFGSYSYGGLFLRMPYRQDQGGSFLSSNGLSKEEADGQRARWAAVSMPVEGRGDYAGMAILDHAENEEHPSPGEWMGSWASHQADA